MSLLLAAAALFALAPGYGLTAPAATERVSVGSSGQESNGPSGGPSINADGRYVAFESAATNLVPDDTNGTYDIFVRDRQAGETRRVSVASDGAEANGPSHLATLVHTAISDDGQYVAFNSLASNLVPGDANGMPDVFVHDLQTGETSLVSVASDGTQFDHSSFVSDMSADGRFVVFFREDAAGGSTMLRDRLGGTTERIATGGFGAVSGDGRYVAFLSAEAVVPGDSNGQTDVFVRDRQTGATTTASVDSNGAQANGSSGWPSISADGRFVAFDSYASNLAPEDANGQNDVFVHDRQTGQTALASAGTDGRPAGGSAPVISAGGRHVAFWSSEPLVIGDTNGTTDVFVRDLEAGVTTRVSVGTFGEETNDSSPAVTFGPQSISGDGRYVAFESKASNLVPDDSNECGLGPPGSCPDVFVHDGLAPVPFPPGGSSPGGQDRLPWLPGAVAGGLFALAFGCVIWWRLAPRRVV